MTLERYAIRREVGVAYPCLTCDETGHDYEWNHTVEPVNPDEPEGLMRHIRTRGARIKGACPACRGRKYNVHWHDDEDFETVYKETLE